MPLERYPIRNAIRRAARTGQNITQRRAGQPAKSLNLTCQTGFHIEKGATIFTVGSCFARNVESALSEFGFTLPAAQIPSQALGLVGKDTGVLNKYTPFSIANEIRWAFDDFPEMPMENALIPQDGNFWDSQLHVRMYDPVDFESALNRRLTVNQAYKSIAVADTAIVTFGLVESWRDTQTGLFLNEIPPRSLMRDNRFELILFSYEECLSESRYILNKIFEINNSINILITVSPVSLGVTFSSDPVAVRNCYSKSVLRAVVEQLRFEFPRVDYYPSYERIIYADRRTAFDVDEIHVTADIVNHTVVSMLEQYLSASLAEFPEGAVRLWWKEVFEGNAKAALRLYQAHPGKITKRMERFPALKEQFEKLAGTVTFD